MLTLTYNLPNDIHTYVITFPCKMIETYYNLLRENGAYMIMLDNEVIYSD